MTEPMLDLNTPGTPWLKDRTIYLTRHGSHAYGTNIATSDVDVKGVAVPPREYFLGYLKHFEQAEFKKPDAVVFDIRKFINLAADCNPNVIEVLYTDESDHFLVTPAGRLLLENRGLFISKKAKHTFSGYAISQLKRIQGHYRWLKNPPKKKPERVDFGLPAEHSLLPPNERETLEAAVKKQIDSWQLDLSTVEQTLRIQIEQKLRDRLFSLEAAEKKRVDDPLWLAAAGALRLPDNVIASLAVERRYQAALKEWQMYERWQRERNPDRAALEEKFGYDCYLDDTEFLTEAGWRKYDEISKKNKLATFNRMTGLVEYQHYTHRGAKAYSGKVGIFDSRFSSYAVTLKHRMLVSKAHRSRANGFSTSYDPSKADWRLVPLDKLLSSTNAHYHIRFVGDEPFNDPVNVPDEYLILMGAYVSEGCVGSRLKDGSASVLRISQKKGNRLEAWMNRLHRKMRRSVRRFEYLRDESWRRKPCLECVWTVAHRKWASKLERECGSGSVNKRLPSWTRSMSSRQVSLLLDVLLAGDGTKHGLGSVYYTASKQLADDIQALCVFSGIPSVVWGPYPNKRFGGSIYQVFIRRGLNSVMATCIREGPQLRIEEMRDVRVVCFTVPNETLVTRRAGKVAIQGNCKHAMHLVRLMRMCREILNGQGVLVRRPDREELLQIRNGAWTYERLIEWADAQERELEELYRTSTLSNIPDRPALDRLCIKIVETFL